MSQSYCVFVYVCVNSTLLLEWRIFANEPDGGNGIPMDRTLAKMGFLTQTEDFLPRVGAHNDVPIIASRDYHVLRPCTCHCSKVLHSNKFNKMFLHSYKFIETNQI